ncbi:putative siderophore transport system ATP-binding protein YusV [Planctomycetes bacterium Pan216]|uniref:Putative siderophore transport system ATP-binding protein YusV n=1 Tax=Kolteria novifilia TaxID=2527975 RepID=A0A518B4L1_9BACT|nr:putative siderophore transport system ATP-binding protein YusV [Planctomycetes bacterium Pan216]
MKLAAEDLSFVVNNKTLVDSVGLSVDSGQWLAIVGPNGAGKTTLLRLLLGLVPSTAGQVLVGGDPLPRLSRQEVAKRIAFVPQDGQVAFGFSVREVVAAGRTPYLGRLKPPGPTDQEAIVQAMREADVTEFADRVITTLSGGERQRVFLARAFAQETPILALDEPTAHLDLYHEQAFLDQVAWRREQGLTVLSVLHDLNLAAAYADRVLLLNGGRVVAEGTPTDVLTEARIASVFRVNVDIRPDERSGRPTVTPRRRVGAAVGT